MKLTPQQEELAKKNATLPFLIDKINEIEARLDAEPPEEARIEKIALRLATKLATTPTASEIADLIPKPEDGHTPTDAELRALIKPLIPEVKDGKTPTKEEILALIRPLIPEVKDGATPTDERLLALIKPLIPPPPAIPPVPTLEEIGNEIPKLGERIRDSLELLPDGEKLKIEAIEDLRKELDALKKQARTTSPSVVISRGAIKLYDLSDSLDGSTKTFALPAFWRVLQVNSSSMPNAFRPTTDYTTDASAMTLTFTDQITAASTLATGQTVTVLYAEP